MRGTGDTIQPTPMRLGQNGSLGYCTGLVVASWLGFDTFTPPQMALTGDRRQEQGDEFPVPDG